MNSVETVLSSRRERSIDPHSLLWNGCSLAKRPMSPASGSSARKGCWLSLATDGPIGSLAARRLGEMARPVRAILFDRTASRNWSLAWHQDRVVAVRARREVKGFGPWKRKHGALHVAPPFELLAGMLTLRVHLDPVPQTNAPLLIAPGSHRFGRIQEADVAEVVDKCGVAMCLAEASDVWIYATPILHASERASVAARRRVLQVDYAVSELPGELQWLGV
ncbi:phytanoyl-CoA dioxygenase family protein [Brevundimonas sp. PAMC22021]|uniref:phytanoyl-CoA dioxygenase family protein n=1 Tax=Brevundimonas sp. PAMC22021 TaxID=2861285 RepID=UPI001C62BEC9|nr:phytanoyl-CoA dioxygenase family protein [Brevundimonas sp. PAMC22021]QYF86573.1 phytanoyl-CoA dioxygenase family protein [Brevundimonas sp. PAMC22021]